jgi:hypothetical protein
MNLAISLIKVWLLAEVLMAAIYLGQWQLFRFLDPAAPAPPPDTWLETVEFVYLLLFLTAVAATMRWWHQTRPRQDRLISLLILAYSLFSLLSFGLWAAADTAGRVAALYVLDAGISLFGLVPGLALIAFMRRQSA